jgi:DNA-directed RNA polymerase specialized sigma24 family protein
MVVTEEYTETREALFTALYMEVFPSVASFIKRRGGSFNDAKDIFQDALIVFYEEKRDGPGIVHDQAYLFGIARHLWYRGQRKAEVPEYVSLEKGFDYEASEQQDVYPSDKKLLDFLTRAGQKCMEILCAFYYDRLSMSKLSDRFGFASERSATVQKYKCMEKVRNQVKIKNMTYEDFLE